MMKKWFALLLCAGLLTGCTRYVPIEMQTIESEISGDWEETDRELSLDTGTAAAPNPATASEPPAAPPQEAGKDRSGPARLIRDALLLATDPENFALPGRDPVKVKGIYVSAYVAGNETMMDNLIAEIDATELNAVVIDFKTDEGYIAAEVDSPLFAGVDACRNYIPDLKGLLEKLKEHDIYAIARIVAFKDPHLAEQRPEWSLKKADGSLYRDKKGLAWVNPYRQEVWDYLVEAGSQAAAAGFDEIQFDYIRFATDSTMREVVFDEADTKGRSKTDIVTQFTEYAYGKLAPLGVFVSADVFGAIIGSAEDAGSVGQIYGEMAGNLDYICPMIYPSHYGDGNFGLDHPDLHPYETILGALQKSAEELSQYQDGGAQAVVRPWLQDFTASYLKHYKKYGDNELRQQIQAVYDAGYEEWILWNASNRYHYGGLLKDDESDE